MIWRILVDLYFLNAACSRSLHGKSLSSIEWQMLWSCCFKAKHLIVSLLRSTLPVSFVPSLLLCLPDWSLILKSASPHQRCWLYRCPARCWCGCFHWHRDSHRSWFRRLDYLWGRWGCQISTFSISWPFLRFAFSPHLHKVAIGNVSPVYMRLPQVHYSSGYVLIVILGPFTNVQIG